MIVSCGEASLDLAPHPVPGGGPLNVSVAVARLGVRSAFVGRVCDEQHAAVLRDHLRANNVGGTLSWLTETVDLSPFGLTPRIIHGGTLGIFRGSTAETLADFVEDHQGLVSFDPGAPPHEVPDRVRWHQFHDRWLAAADIYKASIEDLECIWPGRSPESISRQVLAMGVCAMIITRGASGLSIVTNDGEVEVGTPTITVADTVGAGDAIVATVLVSILEMNMPTDRVALDRLVLADWKMMAVRAVAAAAITCSRVGADPPTRDELDW